MELDVNKCLEELRNDINALESCTSINKIYDLQKSIPEKFRSLDNYLNNLGRLPSEWSHCKPFEW